MINPAELIAHVKDSEVFHFPFGLEWHIPQPLAAWGIHITKFMILELIVAVAMVAMFVPLARRVRSGRPVRGRFWNMLDLMLVFLRDEVARPAIGRHDADRFLPFLWTAFFFILLLNLMGMVPWAGSPTAEIAATGALALVAFITVLGAGMKKFGAVRFWTGQVPHMDIPVAIGLFLKPMMFFLEVFGLCIRHFVLAMRLFANMFAGHLVLAVLVAFLAETAYSWLWYGVAPASIFGATALNLLELMVAFIQAYVFTFLAALFIGMAVHQH